MRAMLWVCAAGAAAGAAAALVAAVKMPLAASPAQSLRIAPISDLKEQLPALPPLEWFEPAWRATIRGPLAGEPAVVASARQSSKPPAPMVRLVGTIIDGRRPRGVFLVGLASIEVKGVGDKAGGADILRIEENAATVSFGGATFTLPREKRPFNPEGDAPPPAITSSQGAAGEGP